MLHCGEAQAEPGPAPGKAGTGSFGDWVGRPDILNGINDGSRRKIPLEEPMSGVCTSRLRPRRGDTCCLLAERRRVAPWTRRSSWLVWDESRAKPWRCGRGFG